MRNRVSVREDWVRDRLAAELDWEGSLGDHIADRLVILIHGYQNSAVKAERSYLDFRAAMRDAIAPGRERQLGPYWEFHWPGNHHRGLISLATYSVRVPIALIAGERLARWFLNGLDKGDQRVILVGHSLGCRVALEAVKTIRQMGDEYKGARIEAVFLLAAAVPQECCRRTGDNKWYPNAYEGSVEHVFHSENDRALGLAFRAGQFGFGEDGAAVGRDGRPQDRWESEVDTQLDHGEYWSSKYVAETIGWLLRLRNLRPLPIHLVPAEASGGPRRRLETQRPAEHRLDRRLPY